MKWIVRGVLAVVAIILVVFVGLFLSINVIAKRAIEQGATSAVGTNTEVEKVDIGLFGGEFTMTGLKIANPEQFAQSDFLKLGQTDAAVALTTLRDDVVTIPRVHLDNIHVTLEKKDGEENYKVILENIKEYSGSGEKEAPPEDKEAKEYVINELLLTNITVTIDGYAGAQGKELKLQDIRLTDVGTGERKPGLGELSGIVIREIFSQMLKNPDLLPGALAAGLGDGLKGLGNLGEVGVESIGEATKIIGGAAEKVGEVSEQVGQKVGEIGEKVGLEGAGEMGEKVGDVGEKIGEEADKIGTKIGEGIGGLLGGNKDKEKEQE